MFNAILFKLFVVSDTRMLLHPRAALLALTAGSTQKNHKSALIPAPWDRYFPVQKYERSD